MAKILPLLDLLPAAESVDYVRNKGQFHLHALLTEQRHEQTHDLGSVVAADTEAGLRAILSVDDDLELEIDELAREPALLEQATDAIVDALENGRRIYVYGCGATGRLAKQLESALWRPFWRRLAETDAWADLEQHLPARIGDALVGEMTGADRALVSSLEGFEDLMLLGALQLRDHGIERGDVVICVTEGGETSSVIGTVLAALGQYGGAGGDLDDAARAAARRNLYFVYNNPEAVLRPFERSRLVLDEPGITRIELATGPQAIAGSTRMQATTIETFVLGAVLEEAVFRLLREHVAPARLRELGFHGDPGIAGRLRTFAAVRDAVGRAVPALAQLTEREAEVYRRSGSATYFAEDALIAVFIDCAERSPTFRLFPLDRSDAPERRSWVQVWTDAADAGSAWRSFLGRPFRGLDRSFYGAPLAAVEDPWLRQAALQSLENAGDDQEQAYDFSFAKANAERRGPRQGDLGVLVLAGGEVAEPARPGSAAQRFAALCKQHGAALAVVRVADPARLDADAGPADLAVDVPLGDGGDGGGDPLGLRRQIALKVLLNAHSTATMARLGRVIGNTMTNVSPSNLKLIGRATFLIMSHVNDVLGREGRRAPNGPTESITFAEANAVLFDAIAWVKAERIAETAEVALSIVRIVESLRRSAAVSWAEARAVLARGGLAAFLAEGGDARQE